MAAKKTSYVAMYDGQMATRTSANVYRFASVVRWSDGHVAVGVRWSATEAGARSCLTRQQRDNGAVVIAVVSAVPQPDLSEFSRQLGSLIFPTEGKA